MKDSELIFGLMATFDKDAYAFCDLKHLTAPFGITEASLRVSLSRMSAKKTIQIHREGKNAYYRFGVKGKTIKSNVAKSFISPDWEAWDLSFWGVIFTVPGEQNTARHAIRKKLIKYRFASMYPGFWIRPLSQDEGIPQALDSILSSGYCSLIKFYHQSELSSKQISDLWRLEQISNDFKEGLRIIEERTKSLGDMSPEQALIEKMTVGNTIVNTLFKDPLLPPQFLPEDWASQQLKQAFKQFDDMATNISQPYWEKIFDD